MFAKQHFRVNKILDYSSTYGIVMGKEARKLRICFKEYREQAFASEISHHIQKNTEQLKVIKILIFYWLRNVSTAFWIISYNSNRHGQEKQTYSLKLHLLTLLPCHANDELGKLSAFEQLRTRKGQNPRQFSFISNLQTWNFGCKAKMLLKKGFFIIASHFYRSIWWEQFFGDFMFSSLFEQLLKIVFNIVVSF